MKKIIGLKPGLSVDKALQMSYNDIMESAAFIGTVMEDGRLRDEISGNIFTYREQIKAGGEAPADSRADRDIIEIAAMLESVRFTVRIDGKSVKPDGSSVIPGVIDYTLPPQLSVDGIGYGVYICNLDLIIHELGMTLTDHGSFYSVTSAPSYSRRIGKKRLASGYLENAGRFSDVWSLCKEISGCNRIIMPLSNQSPKTWMVNLDVDTAKGPKNVEYEWYSVTESRGAELIDLDFAVHATLALGDEVKVVKERDSIINYLGESCLKVIYHNTFRWVSEFEVKPKGLEKMYVTLQQLDDFEFFMGNTNTERQDNVKELNTVLETYAITTDLRISFFMGQVKHESRRGERTLESFSGTTPEAYFNNKYSNRSDLGNQGGNDGELFRGSGYIHLTGRYNYQKFANYVSDQRIMIDGYKLVGGVYNRPVQNISSSDVGVIDIGKYAWESCGWFWNRGNPKTTDLNAYADIKDWHSISSAINQYDTTTFNTRSKYINEFYDILTGQSLGLPQ